MAVRVTTARSTKTPLRVVSDVSSVLPLSLTWPYVGRTRELSLVGNVLRSRERAGVVIAGPVGVGRTRLAREVLRRVPDDTVTEWVAGTDACRAIPFSAFAHIMPFDGALRFDVFERVAAALRHRAAGKNVILAIDDGHLLEDASAALVLHLARSGAARLVVTVRSGIVPPDPLLTLWKDGMAERIDLPVFTHSEVADLLTSVLGGHVDRDAIDRLWDLTRGNLWLLHEVVDDACHAGSLRDEGGIWCWRDELQVSPRLADIVTASMGPLEGGAKFAAELLAVGEPLGCAVIAELAGEEALGQLEERNVAVVEVDGRRRSARLMYPLYGQALRTVLTRTRHAECSRLLGQAMSSRIRRPDDKLRLAGWHLDSGTPAPPDLYRDAATRANERLNHRLAERFARVALQEGAGLTARLALGEALVAQGRCGEAVEVLAASYEPSGDDAELARLAYWHGVAIANYQGDIDAVVTVLDGAESRVVDRRWRDFLRAEKAAMLSFGGRTAEAMDIATELLDNPATDIVAKLAALTAAGRPWAMSGRYTKALETADSLIEPASRLQHLLPRAPQWVVEVSIAALLCGGRLQEASSLIDHLAGSLCDEPRSSVGSHLDVLRARLAMLQGRPLTAAHHLREAIVILRDLDPAGWLPWALSLFAEVCAVTGDERAATAAGSEAEAVANAAVRNFSGDAARARSWISISRGELSAARAQLHRVASTARSAGEYFVETSALHDALRSGDRAGTVERLVELRDIVEGSWSAAFADHAIALTADDGAALDQVAETFTAIGAFRLAAEALAEASHAHRRSGLVARAAASTARSAALQKRCEGSLLPPLHTASSGLAKLSPREEEIAGMAARGMSNREIADRLVVSKRTVEGHLYRLYAKLGITERDELPRLVI